MKLNIIHWPNTLLTSMAQPVTNFDDSLREIVAAMYEVMYSNDGIGLSGNQVGILKRIVVTDVPNHGKLTLINPEIVSFSNIKQEYTEGCLSFPEIFIKKYRPHEIVVTAQDEYGNNIKFTASGLLSICIQHEIDHLNGTVFIDVV